MEKKMYEIEWEDLTEWKEIGSGAFGQVYKAEYLGTEVAIKKFMDIKPNPNIDLKKYIDREVGILQECRHPNVVQFMGVCIHENKCYIVTEYVGGGNLKELLLDATKNLDWREKLSFAIDSARAMVYLHSREIIHRDLKSENFLLTDNKRLKVCDFGLSRETPITPEDVQSLSFCGTDAYMAPEMMLCMPFDTSVDIFSFGIIILEIIFRVVADTSMNGIPSVHPLLDRVIPDFYETALDCCQENAERRPAMKDVLKRLKRIEQSLLSATSNANVGYLTESQLHLTSPSIEDSTTSLNSSVNLSQSFKNKIGFTKFEKIRNSNESDLDNSNKFVGAVPHRFSLMYNLTKSRCNVCSRGFGMTGRHLICDDCGCQVHKRCGIHAEPNFKDVDETSTVINITRSLRELRGLSNKSSIIGSGRRESKH
ncbi:hypothetical protein HK099_007097 [Clydaea vesicula]|uniref:Uncharacterized protein n=1 Tax=Clydaea vesicula TaxID=447962 RepID=A0AAD5XYP6_9FUNG|nr:hypothetical protein HK099_007097 [Clydaea vesicula]